MSLFFLFKRAAGMALQPLPVVFGLLLLGLLAFRFRKRWLAKFLCGLSVAVLLASCLPPAVRLAAWPLESRHRPLLSADADGLSPKLIVVLGNGVAHPNDAAMPALTRLNDCARARLVEGVRLAGMFPEAALVVSGYGMGLENCADAMALAAVELGVDSGRVRALAESLDTEHEARLVAELAEGGRVVLATSAVHMPRSLLFFTGQGVDVVPATCDYIGPLSPASRGAVNRRYWRPVGGALADSEALWHEYLGLVYYHLFRSGRG